MTRFLLLAAFLLVLATSAGHAQGPALSLIGSVQSDERQPLAGAAITVVHVPSGVRHAAATDGTGRFEVANLVAGGPYMVRVGEGGYHPQTMENIYLESGKSANLTLTLSKLTPEAPSTKGRAGRLAAESVAPAPAGVPPLLAAGPGPAAASSSVARSTPYSARGPFAPNYPPGSQPDPAQTAPPAQTGPPAPAAPTAPAASPYVRYPRRTTPPRTDPIVPGRFDAQSGNYLYDTGLATTLKLPGGATLTGVGLNSTESYLFRFLSDPKARVDSVDLTNGWYNFDKVFFETGKATLTPESIGQLRNIAALLRAFPRARIKLGGYTDNTGDYRLNRQLSEARARTAWASLVEMGINPGRIDARGYGSGYAIAPNATEEGRAQNRRLSIKVLQK